MDHFSDAFRYMVRGQESPPTQFAIVDDMTDKVVGMAGTYEKALECARLNVPTSLLSTLAKETLGLQSRGKDSAGRFYSAMAEKEFYLEVFPYCAEHDYKLDKKRGGSSWTIKRKSR